MTDVCVCVCVCVCETCNLQRKKELQTGVSRPNGVASFNGLPLALAEPDNYDVVVKVGAREPQDL